MIPRLVLPMALGAMGLLLAVLLIAGLGNGERADYLPISRHSPGWVCLDSQGHLHAGEMEEWVWAAAADELRHLDEPALYRPAEVREFAPHTWRLTWLRSFDPPVIVRVSEHSGGSLRLDAVHRAGRGLYRASPRVADERVSRWLTADEAELLRRTMTETRVFDGSPTECEQGGTDGAEWVLETNGPAGYRVVQSWTPAKDAAVRVASDALLDLTGWNFKGQYERN